MAGVRPEDLGGRTLCTQWDTRALLNHLIGGNHMWAALGAGQELGRSQQPPDFASDNPAGAYRTSANAAVETFRAPGAMERTFKAPIGDIPGQVALGLALMDTVVHGWDLAKATGPIDAPAVARAALREPDLPVASLDGAARRVRLLVDHRDDLVAERTRIQRRLRWHLHELAPGLQVRSRGLGSMRVLDQVDGALAGVSGLVAELARELVGRCRALTVRSNELERDLKPLVGGLAPSLLAIVGCGVLTAAKLVGETAGASRFRSPAAFARFNGTAPIPVWSANRERFRRNRGGNRQVNLALHVPGPAAAQRLPASFLDGTG